MPIEMKKPAAPVAAMVETQKRSPLLLVVAVLLLVGLGVAALYLSFAKSAIVNQQKQLDDDIASVQTQLTTLQGQKVEAAQAAQQWLGQVSKTEVRWSKVINSVKDLIPLDAITQQPKVHFLSYAGSPDGKLNLNGETSAASTDPFADISQMVNTFNTSAFFKDAYVPSITRGVTEGGQVVLSFIFNVTYSEETISTLTPASYSTIETNFAPLVTTPVSTQQSSSQQVKVPTQLSGSQQSATPVKVKVHPNQ